MRCWRVDLKLMKDFFIDAVENEAVIQRGGRVEGNKPNMPQKIFVAYVLLIILYRSSVVFFVIVIVIQVHVDKRVPIGAGLGGGSSNAATALWAANQLNGCLATDKELQEWSSKIGSDVPFFSNGAAYYTGRGEIVQDIPSSVPFDLTMILIKAPKACSTTELYKGICRRAVPHRDLRENGSGEREKNDVGDRFYDDGQRLGFRWPSTVLEPGCLWFHSFFFLIYLLSSATELLGVLFPRMRFLLASMVLGVAGFVAKEGSKLGSYPSNLLRCMSLNDTYRKKTLFFLF
ncbi:hypothetical protein L1987_85730 [Smallanthus sonchifolius]|uniref:Uncharacterized protein n=1 Tax=Smallanthus sonchifolius TaxID=185202 RepID=A0ACB8Y1I4_9ASTR|nr:hypothetical protein L1987_85730 [Smallanthus sonchifolius]